MVDRVPIRQTTVAGGSRSRRGVGLLRTRELQWHFLDSYFWCSSTAGVGATALLITLLVLKVQKGAPSTEITAQAMISKSIGAFDCRTYLLLSQSLTGSQKLMEYSNNRFTKGPSGEDGA